MEVRVRPVAEDALNRSRRYFLDQSGETAVQLINACDPSASVWADPWAITRMLINCVKNALDSLRISKKAGTVRITCFDEPGDPDTFVCLNVSDNAGGIPTPVLQRLGHRWVSTRGEEGAGLGVFIMLDLLKRLNGWLVVASSTQEVNGYPAGSVVSLVIPRRTIPAVPDRERPIGEIIVREDYAAYCRRVDEVCPEREGG
jgi:two-component system sensor histidine kinase RegB